jgi:two-component system response regulator AgrA
VVKGGEEAVIKKRVEAAIDTALKRHISGIQAKKIQIKNEDVLITVAVDEIIFIETSPIRNKLRLHTKTRRLDFNGVIKKIADELDERFVNCHRSFIVNRDFIEEIHLSENMVTMSNGIEVPISRTGKKLLNP